MRSSSLAGAPSSGMRTLAQRLRGIAAFPAPRTSTASSVCRLQTRRYLQGSAATVPQATGSANTTTVLVRSPELKPESTNVAPSGISSLFLDGGAVGDKASSMINASAAYADEVAPLRFTPMNYAGPDTDYTVDNVAAADAQRFRLHPSVAFWQSFRTQLNARNMPQSQGDKQASADVVAELSSMVRDVLATSATSDVQSAAYWAYHLGIRTPFFLATSAGGALLHHLRTQLSTPGAATPFQNLSANMSNEIANRMFEGIAMYQQDLENIKAGAYKLPWDMTTINHRQFNPLFALNRSMMFLEEATTALQRKSSSGSTDNWISRSGLYPDYYLQNTFHYQTDGWLSQRSADIYEYSTEALFFGRQDAMQRTSLLPIAEWMAETRRAAADVRLLEVACGTGRFHTFIKDNYPTMKTVASDLSPFYLGRARDNVRYWHETAGKDMGDLGGSDGTGTEFYQCAAEKVPAPDESFDIVVMVYTLHEMPESARVAAAKEFARVLKPGGLCVITDSAQLGDRPQWDKALGAFGSFNEPHYRNYISNDLGAMFEDAGLQPHTKYAGSATKTLSFRKPFAAST